MKKLALILALLIIPCSAFGLEMLNDSALDGVTGQAGIDIAADDIQIFINIEKMAWIDCDGYSSLGQIQCAGDGGAIALNNFQIDVLNINAIIASVPLASTDGDLFNNQSGTSLGLRSVNCGKIPLFYNYATDTSDTCYLNDNVGTANTRGLDHLTYGGTLALSGLGFGSQNVASGTVEYDSRKFTPHFLSIDVTDELPAATDGLKTWQANSYTTAAVTYNGGDSDSTIGGVLIGLPTMEIYIHSMSFTPVYDGDISGATSNAINDDNNILADGQTATYGTIEMQGITFSVLSGWIEIAPH